MRRTVGWLALTAGLLALFLGFLPGASAGPQPTLTLNPNKTTFHVGDTVTVSTNPLCIGTTTGQVRLLRGALTPDFTVPANLPVALTVDGTVGADHVLTANVHLTSAGTFIVDAACTGTNFGGFTPAQITVLAATVTPASPVVGNPHFTG